MDEKDGETFKWLMISWSPDSASIRNKMLYASTKATLKKEFGGGQILDDLYGNVRVSTWITYVNQVCRWSIPWSVTMKHSIKYSFTRIISLVLKISL